MNPTTSTPPPNDEDIIKSAMLENGFVEKSIVRGIKLHF